MSVLCRYCRQNPMRRLWVCRQSAAVLCQVHIRCWRRENPPIMLSFSCSRNPHTRWGCWLASVAAADIWPCCVFVCLNLSTLGKLFTSVRLCGIVVRLPVLASKLSLSCARLTAARVTTLWVKRPVSVNQHGQLSQPSLRGRLNE